jgi:DNA-binding ferritin-like protein
MPTNNIEKIAEGDVKEFKLLLSFLRALSHIYQYMHWRSAGTNYYGDHLLYERLYNSATEGIDAVAEKVIGITNDSASIHPIEDIKFTSAIVTKFVKGEFNPESFSEIGIAAEKELIKLIKKMMSGGQSDGVENMLQGIADKHEGHLYLLQQRSKTAMAKISTLMKMANKFDATGEFELANQIDEIINILAADARDVADEEKSHIFGKVRETIEKEMDQILGQIHKIETRKPLPYEDESNYQTLSFLRERYKKLEKELKDFSPDKGAQEGPKMDEWEKEVYDSVSGSGFNPEPILDKCKVCQKPINQDIERAEERRDMDDPSLNYCCTKCMEKGYTP